MTVRRGDDGGRSSVTKHRSRTSDSRAHTALLLEVSRMYYEEELTQLEIANRLLFSRTTVSRMLTEAKKRGIVHIRITHPMERVLGLERSLVQLFGLKQARVADSVDPLTTHIEVARGAADLVVENSAEDTVITVSNGLAVTATVEALPQLAWPRSRVVQMIGSTGQSQWLLDSSETCRRMARKLGGAFHPIPAPLVVGDPVTAAALKSDGQVATTLELGARADLALTGIGAVTEGRSGLILREHENDEVVRRLQQMGAVAHIAGYHLSQAGDLLDTDLTARTIAVPPDRLREIPLVVGVAWGEAKVAAIAAVLRGGFISALVTDLPTAVALLNYTGN